MRIVLSRLYHRLMALPLLEKNFNLQSRHDLAVEQVEGRYHLIMREVADVKHAHKMRRTNLAHLLLELPRH
jgi:hypothetical protein